MATALTMARRECEARRRRRQRGVVAATAGAGGADARRVARREQAASSGRIRDMLQASVRLAGGVDSTAEAKALYALGCYEGQYATVAREAADTVVKALDGAASCGLSSRLTEGVEGDTRHPARRRRRQAAAGGPGGQGREEPAAKLRSGLEHKIEELQKKLARTSRRPRRCARWALTSSTRSTTTSVACRRRRPPTACARAPPPPRAGCGSTTRRTLLSRRRSPSSSAAPPARERLPPEFVAYVPQLTSRLGSDEACDEFAASTASSRAPPQRRRRAGGRVRAVRAAPRRDRALRAAAAEKLFTRLRSRATRTTR